MGTNIKMRDTFYVLKVFTVEDLGFKVYGFTGLGCVCVAHVALLVWDTIPPCGVGDPLSTCSGGRIFALLVEDTTGPVGHICSFGTRLFWWETIIAGDAWSIVQPHTFLLVGHTCSSWTRTVPKHFLWDTQWPPLVWGGPTGHIVPWDILFSRDGLGGGRDSGAKRRRELDGGNGGVKG